ncbi:hypothetical protein PEBR_28606 [Penicillium brasilianum]|uniref:Uncharacterized protein n=1 Tax=Penicillium brasilianum TaxID=104259 RepID=A0A1S9RIH4_PENBI|nr:hypothetical protein PEBR_28606 [Penicillium brasilianum]
MPPSKPSPSSRHAEYTLGMTPNEIRLLLLAHLCFDKDSGKMDHAKLAARAKITVPSAKTMYRGALTKLARKNPEPTPGTDNGDGAGPSTVASPAAAKPGHRRGRPRKAQVASAETTAAPQTTGYMINGAQNAPAQNAPAQATKPQPTAARTTGAHTMANPAMVFGYLPDMQDEGEGVDMTGYEM